MSHIPFEQTAYGRRFFEQQLPELVRQLAAITAAPARMLTVEERARKTPCLESNPSA